MYELRDYQRKSIEDLYEWFGKHEGNPCIVLPTGAGKSLVIAEFCRRAVSEYPDTRILMLTHQKELIEQDYMKLMEHWPEADAGIYSAGIGKRELGRSITFAGIQSVYRRAAELGKVDIVVIDEAHLINHEATGMYRRLLDELKASNPYTKAVGLTATPYRLGHGMITDEPALFSMPLIEPVTVGKLQEMGYLTRLTSKITETKLDTSGVPLVGGDFNQKRLNEAVDIAGTNEEVVEEVVKRCWNRKSWLFFCSGVSHAEHIRDLLRKHGIKAECVSGETPKREREQILHAFKEGWIQAVTNANVLTTGFDHPGIDLIVMLRPTKSPGLYVQMAGRGLRISPDKENCLVLDFAGNVVTHGPITCVRPPKKASKGDGIAPSKICPGCGEIVAMNTKVCPVCYHEFPVEEPKEKEYKLSKASINGESRVIMVNRWLWTRMSSKAGNEMFQVRYYPQNILEDPVCEYLVTEGSEYAVRKAEAKANAYLMAASRGMIKEVDTHSPTMSVLANGCDNPPVAVLVHRDGKYDSVDMVAFDFGDCIRWWDGKHNRWRESE